MILSHLQERIESQYDLEIPYDVAAFVSHDIDVARTLASVGQCNEQTNTSTELEEVFIRQDNETLELTLYLDKDLVQTVDPACNVYSIDLKDSELTSGPSVDDICTVVEGVSHAVCLLWHAHNDRQIRPVDLELQAEIDKFTLLLNDSEKPSQHRQLHYQLFRRCEFTAAPGSAMRERYRVANDLAAHYCHWLADTFIESANSPGLDTELARFYRLSGTAKFEYIRRLH